MTERIIQLTNGHIRSHRHREAQIDWRWKEVRTTVRVN